MLFAVIDIGSNAIRLLFANAHGDIDNINIEKASLIRVPLRLGKDVFNSSEISKSSEKKLLKTMKAFKLLIGVMEPIRVRTCATSAMREAENSKKIIKKVRTEIGINIEIISGIEEADIIRKTNKLNFEKPHQLQLMIDVGGGSTEVSVEQNGKLITLKSFKIGTIRMIHNNFKPEVWQEITDWLNNFKSDFGKINVVGSGGNINKIRKQFGDKSKIELSTQTIENTINLLEPLSMEERITQYNLRNDRADVIVHASKIYLYILKQLQSDTIYVPRIGLADGMAHLLYQEYLEEYQ